MVDWLLFRFKSGNVFPTDISFEEIHHKTGTKLGTLGRKKSKQKQIKLEEDTNQFSRKTEIKEKIICIESKIDKGNFS